MSTSNVDSSRLMSALGQVAHVAKNHHGDLMATASSDQASKNFIQIWSRQASSEWQGIRVDPAGNIFHQQSARRQGLHIRMQVYDPLYLGSKGRAAVAEDRVYSFIASVPRT